MFYQIAAMAHSGGNKMAQLVCSLGLEAFQDSTHSGVGRKLHEL